MKRFSLAAVAASLALIGVAAPTASADSETDARKASVEPIVVIAGGQIDCDVSYNDGGGSWYNGMNGPGGTASGVANKPAAQWGVPALTNSQVFVWTSIENGIPGDETYKLCEADTSVPKLAGNLYRRLLRLKTQPGWTGPKVDIIAASVGAVIGRWCVSKVPGCAALVDDFIGIVPPNYGTTIAYESSCPYMGVFGAYTLCMALDTNGGVIQQLNGLPVGSPTYDGQWTNNGVDDSPGDIQYTNFYSNTDGVIQNYNRARLLDGAYNVRVYKPSNQLTHQTVGDTGVCPGSLVWPAPTVVEWAVYLARDIAMAPAPIAPAASSEGISNCYIHPADGPKLDANGNPVLDANGNPVPSLNTSTTGLPS